MKNRDVFLVTTSIKKTFPIKEKKLLLAGEWCKDDVNEFFLNKYQFQTLPYHWDDEKKRSKDSLYLKKIYYKLESDLSLYFNKVHETNFSRKYWSIIISPWLSRFIISVFDKYSVIKKVKKEFKVKNTKIINFTNYNETVPQNIEEANYYFQSHHWNHKIFALLIKKLLLHSKILEVKKKFVVDLPKVQNDKNSFKQKFIRFYCYISNFLRSNNESFVINTYLGFFGEVLLNLKLNNNFKINLPFEFNRKFKIDKNLRQKKLKINIKDDEFTKVLKEIIPQNIPAYYLEGYKSLSNSCLQVPWIKDPKIIFTANSHLGDEIFNFWTAQQLNKKNIPLVYGQHGGGFFTSKYSIEREIEIAQADKFLAWGNAREKSKKIIKFYNLKSIFKKLSYNPNGKINLIQHMPRAYQMSCLSGQLNFSQAAKNSEFQKKFLKGLKKNYFDKTEVRLYFPYASNLSYQQTKYEKDLWSDKKLKIKIETPNTSMAKSINDSRLLILTGLESTILLESMFNNIPSILLMNFDKKFIKEKHLGIFRLLMNNGILYDDPKVLSDFINSNYQNIDLWWKSRKIQKTVKKFCDHFSASSSSPLKQFKETVEKIINQSKKTINL
jgi:putative transferase (TIGR04331 family)